MGQAIGDILPMAIGVAISPVPIIAIVLMLGTPRARSNGPAFAVGWVAGLAIVGTITLVLASGNASTASGPETWTSVLKLVLGSLTILAPLAIYFAMGARAKEILDGLKEWLAANNATIMTVLLLVLGAKLIGDAISGFSS